MDAAEGDNMTKQTAALVGVAVGAFAAWEAYSMTPFFLPSEEGCLLLSKEPESIAACNRSKVRNALIGATVGAVGGYLLARHVPRMLK